MRTVRIVVFVGIIGLVCTPFLITRSHAERSAGAKARIPNVTKGTTVMAAQASAPQSQRQQIVMVGEPGVDAGPMSPEMSTRLGLGPQQQPATAREQSKSPGVGPESGGLPSNMSASAAMSAAVTTTIAKGFFEMDTMGDWDGREDDTADHSGKVLDSTNVPPAASSNPNFFLTRAAISEHTIANGFTEDIFYSGDSIGNVYVASTTNLTQAAPTPTAFTIDLRATLNGLGFGPLTPANKIAVTGLAVNPVADLGAFSGAFPAYAADFPAGTIGEILYVSFTDTGSTFLVGVTQVRSGVLAIPIRDAVNAGAPVPPGRISPASYPVTVGGPVAVIMSTFSNLAGCAVDDDGNLYFQQVDLVGLTGGSITKVSSLDTPANQDRALVVGAIAVSSTLTNSGTNSGPATQVNRYTTFAGPSTFFGNVVSLATGQGNLVYAAVARSLNPADAPVDQATEGPFQNPGGLGATPAMVITLADAKGSFDNCSAPNRFDGGGPGTPACPGCPANTKLGIVPVGDGIADTVPGTSSNWTAFILGNGPDRRAASGTDSLIFGTPANTLKLDMLIDPTIYSGITVDEEGTVYVISGGTPAGVGSNPSGNRGEILSLEDKRPGDRRADYIDFRGDQLPNPPAAATNVGDGDSDRFDHVYMVAPIDSSTLAPAGLAGLSRGFLRYTNRLAPSANPTANIGPDANPVTLGVTDRTQADDDTTHDAGSANQPIIFEKLDPSHQVAGGDDQVSPFTGDDSGGAGSPALAGPLNGGFEFLFANPLGDVFQVGAACGTGNGVWNGFFLNSNGSITFGDGDTGNVPSVTGFRAGLPKIAPAWADLNPAARGISPGTFPVQALGFANINAFKIRNINVPQFGDESCAANNATGSGMTNTYSITLYDDGTGVDENSNQPLNPANPIGNNAVPFDLLEGPTANRFVKVATAASTVLVGEVPRLDGSGLFNFNYGRMDLLGDSNSPVMTGYSIGKQSPIDPPGQCEIDLGAAAVSADTGFGNIQGQTETRWPTFIGDGTEPEIHEYYHNAVRGTIDPGTGVFTLSQPDFDLRFEGNGDATPVGQIRPTDVNRDKMGLYGTDCQLPSNPQLLTVLANPFVTTPGTAPNSLINAYGPITINLLGTGFFPSEATTLCAVPSSGDAPQPEATPVARPGMTVSTAVIANFDTNGDGVPDLPVSLSNITPVSRNLVTAVAAPLPNASGQGLGSPWPFIAPGGVTQFTITTTLTAGNNNIFNLLSTGGFTRTSSGAIPDFGARAPVVVGSSPSGGDSAVIENLTITGWDFQSPLITTGIPPRPLPATPVGAQSFPVTGVFAVQRDNPANVIQATTFNVLNNNTISASFNFAGAPTGRQFLIFVQNAAGISRNALTAPGGASPNGNEQGDQPMFTVTDTVPPTIACPAGITAPADPGSNSAVVKYSDPQATDNQPGVTASCDRPSGSKFSVGTTMVKCTAIDTSNNTATCSFAVTVNAANNVTFSASNFTVNEGDQRVNLTLNRSGNTTAAASVSFATVDSAGLQNCDVNNGIASPRCDYISTIGTVNFGAGETSKSFSVAIIDDSYAEGPETFSIALFNPSGMTVGTQAVATVTIIDNDSVTGPNPIDTTGFFVRQHYLDFLGREPDPEGFAAWVRTIDNCPAGDTSCDRAHVSSVFYQSEEFQQRGSFVYKLYPVGLGRKPDYGEFVPDLARVSGFLTDAELDAAKSQLVADFMSRPAFASVYDPLSNAQYVDALLTTSAVTLLPASRQEMIDGLNNSTLTRAQVLRQIVESSEVSVKYFNQGFGVMEYFGYLRRQPDAFYLDWVQFLDGHPGDARTMVTGFVNSAEYRKRFGP